MTPVGTFSMLRWPPVSSSTRLATVEQTVHQRIDVRLQQGLPTGDFHQRRAKPFDFCHDLVDRHLPPLVKRVRRVTPRTAQITRSQADEDAWLTGKGGLTLDRVENLVDG